MNKNYFSLILTTKRGIESLKHLFKNTDENTEIVISDHNYNEKTKKWLSQQSGYEKITYVPIKDTPFPHHRDFAQGLNTALMYAENGWIIRGDDNIEFKEDFFDTIRKDIESFKELIQHERFAFIGQKLWSKLKHEKWNDYVNPSDPSRYIKITDPKFTFSFGLYPIDMVYQLNGYDERYDIGWGYEDVSFLHRALVAGYTVYFDRELMGFSTSHVPKWDSIPVTETLYNYDKLEIQCGKIQAFNPFNIRQQQSTLLAEKDKWVVGSSK